MKAFYLRNFRKGLATNSSSTHSVIYQNKESLLQDLNIFELDFYGRCDETIAASRDAKIKYVLANIFGNDILMEHMLIRFPEMKEYFPLIRKQIDYATSTDWTRDPEFGTGSRGSLYTGNLEFDIEHLTNVINNPEIVIVGGSDELNFVYDTIEGHRTVFDESNITNFNRDWFPERKVLLSKNGNYWTAYGREPFHGRIRISTSKEELVPQFPELIDLRITNKCNHGCEFCFMNSKSNSPHANINYIRQIVYQVRNKVEFSIGGGNILLHPDLKDILKEIKDKGHIVNVTIHWKDCETILENKTFKDIFVNYVDGIGISVFNIHGIESVIKFRQEFKNKYITVHTIPEYLGTDKMNEMFNYLRNARIYGFNFLFLGYKETGRGSKCNHHIFTNNELRMLFKNCHGSIGIDTSFANTYKDWLSKNYEVDQCVTWNEGEFSMYIDAVRQRIYKSSYQLQKPYWITQYKVAVPVGVIPKNNLSEIFESIRKDGGFKPYNELPKYYDKPL